MPEQVRFDAPGKLHHVIVGDWMGVALAEVAQRVGGNLHRIQNYAADYPVSQPGPRVSLYRIRRVREMRFKS